MSNGVFEEVTSALNEVKEDNTVPKNVRTKIDSVIGILAKEEETSIKVSKAINELEEIAEDVNLQPYTRTQVWDAISHLENTQ